MASNNTIPDSSFAASSSSGSDTPSKGRLNGRGAWSPSNDKNDNDYLEIDLQYEFLICALATQGKSSDDHWTTKYKLLTSLNNKDWVTYQENETEKVCFKCHVHSNIYHVIAYFVLSSSHYCLRKIVIHGTEG